MDERSNLPRVFINRARDGERRKQNGKQWGGEVHGCLFCHAKKILATVSRADFYFPIKPQVKLTPEDSHHLRAAEGWLELSDHVSAFEELEEIDHCTARTRTF
jgi:hypothetical protein